MKDGRITQAGKYNEILHSGTEFMELVGAHKKALSALDSAEARSESESRNMSKEVGDMGITDGVAQKKEKKDVPNGKADDVVGSEGQIIQEEGRETGKVGFSVYWKYISMANRGALVPCVLLAQVLYQFLQIGSNYWMALAATISQDVNPAVSSSTLIIAYVALAIGSSFCILVRLLLLSTAGFKTTTLLFNKMHLCIFRAPISFFDANPSGKILNRVSGKCLWSFLGGSFKRSIVYNLIWLFLLRFKQFLSLSLSHTHTHTHTHTHALTHANTFLYINMVDVKFLI